jgi:hypothetical protein
MKAIFKNDYSWKSGSTNPQGSVGGAPNTIDYKKGDALTGLSITLSDDKKQVISNMGNFKIGIPVENLTILNDDGTPINDSSTDVAPKTFLEKNKTNLLIVGVLVLGYLAYKKFNK